MKGVIILVLFLTTLASCGKHDWPAESVAGFMNSCNESCLNTGNDEVRCNKLCSCSLEELQKKFSFKEYAKIETRMIGGDQSAINTLLDAGSICRVK